MNKQAEKLKSFEMKDEGWRMKDEGWRMKDEGLKGVLLKMDRQTDEQTDILDCRVAFVTEN